MPYTRGTRRHPIFGGAAEEYSDKVLGYNPVAYWPLWEASGGVANCLVNSAQNGAYTGVSLGQEGIGDGRTCPLFDGINDFVNIFSTTLRDSAFNGEEGTLFAWAKVLNVGVWTDGTLRVIANLETTVQNMARMRNPATGNLSLWYEANNVAKAQTVVTATVDWFTAMVTWSLSNDRANYYLNGASQGELTGLGTWAGVLSSNDNAIGADITIPNGLWSGWIAHVALWDNEQSAAVAAALTVV